MRLSFDGSDNRTHTLADLRAFIAACDQLGMPPTAKVIGKTKITGSGPLKTLTAEWDEVPYPLPARIEEDPGPITRPFPSITSDNP
jgi:hypothetical protein